MSCNIAVKSKRVFIVGNETFNKKSEATEYLKSHPYEYDGERYAYKREVLNAMDREKQSELNEIFERVGMQPKCQYVLGVRWCGSSRLIREHEGRKLREILTSRDFLEEALQVVEKYDRLMEPFKEDEE